jgi:hypothetical protein
MTKPTSFRGYIAILLRRLYFKIYQYFYPAPTLPSDPAQLPLIYKLPRDIICYLGNEVLPPADRAAFALTGKAFWISLDGEKLLERLDPNTEENKQQAKLKQDRLDFLWRLQHRYPKHLLCSHCAIFHRRQKDSTWDPVGISPCDVKNGIFRDSNVSLFLPFSYAQEVMNRHRYGRAYGCPASDIEYNHDCNNEAARQYADVAIRGWRERRRLSARVINNELVVKIDLSRLFLFHDDVTKAGATGILHRGIGSHSGGEPWRRQREELKGKEDASLHFRCRKCECELRCKVMDPGYYGEYGEVRISMWLTLGSCETPHDPKWLRAIQRCQLGYNQCYRIDPAESLYARYFDDASPYRAKVKWLARPYNIPLHLRY